MRVQVNEEGEFYIILPEDIVDEMQLDEGDKLGWEVVDNDLLEIRPA